MSKRICIINNYSNQEIRIPVERDSNPSIDTLVEIITNKYNRDNSGNIKFSLSKNLSTNPSEFEESINKFIEKVVEDLEEQKINFKKDELVSKLQSYYLTSTITVNEDSENEAELPESKVISIEEQKALELDDALDELFNDNYAIKSHFLQEFKHQLKDKTIIHIDETVKKSRIVYDTASLNQSITEFMNQLYRQIVGYMQENNISLPKDVTNMFIQEGKSNRQYRINPGYIDVLNAFYNYCINNTNYQDILEADFHNKILGNNQKNTLLEAVQAYVGIMYFDRILKQTLPKYIYVNDDLPSPISYTRDGEVQYKYNINRKNINLKSGWHSEISDGIAEMGNFSVMAIETIPLRNKYGYLTKQDFIISFMKLKNLVQSVSDKTSSLYRAQQLLKTNPVEAWKIILEYVKNADKQALDGKIDAKVRLMERSIKNHKISDNDWNVYVSVYDYIFDKGFYTDESGKRILTKPGVYYIEQDFLKSKGVTDTYSITQAIFGTLNSTQDLNYYVFRYDQNKEEWVGEEKSKYYADQNRFQIKYSINKNSKNVASAGETLHSYDFNFGENISFKIGSNKILIKSKGDKVDGIFNISDSTKSFEIFFNGTQIDFNQYFSQQLNDIMYPSKRNKLIHQGLDGKDLEFMLLLKTFDNLFGTNYSTNELGLQEFRILYDLNHNALELLTLESGHLLSSLFLNNEFDKKRGSTFTFKELDKWISKQGYPYLKGIDRLSKKDKRKYIEESKEGNFLLGFSSNNLLDNMGDARTIILGDNNKSTIKNANNDSIPNTSVAYTDFKDELLRQEDFEFQYRSNPENKGKKTPVGHLLFIGKSNAIKTVVVDTEIIMPDKTSKQVSRFTASELLYHAIYNKFFLSGKGQWLSQPITYSDKTKFLNLLIDIKSILGESNPFIVSNEQFEQKILDTIGNYYKQLYKNIADDYRKIFNISESVSDIQVYNIANKQFEELSKNSLNPFDDFIQLAYDAGVEVYEDLHYRKGSIINANGEKVDSVNSTNELLDFLVNNVYRNQITLHNMMEEEKLNFINSLLKENTIFPISSIKKSIDKNLETRGVDPNIWTKNGLLILGKITNSQGKVVDVISGNQIKLQEGEIFTINPLLETYFYMHNLIDNNAKLHFSGNELVHKLKPLGNITNKVVSKLSVQEKDYIKNITKKDTISLEDVVIASQNSGSIANSIRVKTRPYLKRVLSGEHNAQFKRTVPIPGTMRLFDQNRIDGIANKYKVSVIQDIQAEVNDLSGNYGYSKSKTIDAHDGSAWVDPFTSILENKSLSESECGHVKKPLWDIDEPKYGTRRLVKYASNAITNEIMRNSARGASINMYRMFKKMTNLRWDDKIDLTHWDAFGWDEFTFKSKILRENDLYYKKGTKYFKILDFGIQNGIYWTKEQEVDDEGIPIVNTEKILYHSFNEQGDHFISSNPQIHPNATHTIDSLFELHKVFGGINSVSLVNKRFIYGEDSNHVVVAFMNGVTYKNDNYYKLEEKIANKQATKRDLVVNQTYYTQPLKTQLINVIINQSAIKNGASNINSSDSYFNDDELRYSIFDTTKYGIQLDADHNADEAEVTETSQVISALDATGIYHDEVLEIYKALGRQTIKASELEVKVTKAYLNSLNPNNLDEDTQKEIKKVLKKDTLSNEDLQEFILNNPKNPIAIKTQEYIRNKFDGIYDVIGRVIINNIKSGNKTGLTNSIISIIKEQFNLSDSHIYDKFKIPFSDPNIYSNILSTVSSVLNRKSIKRKYPGTGQIMVPSYGIYQTYETQLEDGTTQYLTGEDLLKEAIIWNQSINESANTDITSLNEDDYSDIEQFNQDVIQLYLQHNFKNDNVYNGGIINDWKDQLSSLNPTDNVTVVYKDSAGNEYSYDLTLDSLIKYYNFTENPLIYLQRLKLPILNIVSIERNNRKPKDLAPMRVNFTYVTTTGEQKSINLFNTWIYRELFKAINEKNSARINELQSRLQNFVTKIDEGFYEQEDGSDLVITNVKKRAAQTIQSYNYRTLFGIKEGDTLADIKKQGVDYFKNQFDRYNPINSALYDYDFQIRNLNNKDNIYISIDGSTEHKKLFTAKVNKWKTASKRIENVNKGKVVNRVYIMSDDNRKLFEISRDLDVSDQYTFDKSENIIKDREGNKVDDKNIFEYRGKILKRVQFLTQYKIFPTNGKAFIKYNIDRNALQEVLLLDDDPKNSETVENAIKNIIQDIFESDSYLFIQPADIIRTNKYKLIKDIVRKFSYDYKGNLKDYYKNLVNNVFSRSQTNLTGDLVYLNSGWKPSKEELAKFDLEIPENVDIFTFLRRNKRKFTKEQDKLYNDLWARYINSQLSSHTQEFIEQHAIERYNSFLKSLYVTSSRIPAQELQSFMQMETVGFTGIGSNISAVSHFQMFLQGSDLDIDKSYMMGLVMDNNGRYLGWSKLFDLTSLENIEASETLPLPQGRTYVKSDSGIIIDESEYNNATSTAEQLVAIGKILKRLNSQNSTELNISDELLDKLNQHESTKLPVVDEENILKNYISSNIQQLIQRSGNILSAYTPIDLNVLNDAKPESDIDLNLFNPATVYIMQYQNMSGKQVTGIAANGQKASFMWKFATIEGLKNGEDKYVDFDITINRVAREKTQLENGEIIERIVPKRLQTLPNINLEQVATKLRLIAKVAPSNVLSQYISAATDNAKELILSVINSGSNLAKCHLYLATLGFEVSDIVKFMTSPAVSFINDMSNGNIFLAQDIKMKDIFNYITQYHNIRSDSSKTEDEKIEELSKLSLKGANRNLNESILAKLTNIYNEGFYTDSEGNIRNSIYEDMIDFKNILVGANEFSNLGRGLGLNQGVATTKENLTKFKNFLTQIMSTAENEKGIFDGYSRKLKQGQTLFNSLELEKFKDIIDNGFDVDRWLNDLKYRNLVNDYYNKLKHSINVFYIFNKLPHFNAMFEIANSVNIIDGNLSLKSVLFNRFSKELREKYKFIPPKYEDGLLKALDEVLIENFISKIDFKLPLQEGWTTLTKKFEIEQVNTSKTINVARNPSAFKYVFENYVIPMLKNVEEFKHNNFIQNLIQTYDQNQNIPLYKANIDMLRKDSSPELYLKYQELLKGFRELSKYDYAGHSLTDWFILYNLIVNKNKYGSEKLTTIFDDILRNNRKSLIFQQLKALGDEDYYKTSLSDLLQNVTLTDLLIKIAPVVSVESNRQEPFIIVYSPTEGFVIKEKKGWGYSAFVNLVIPIEGESVIQQEERVIRQQQYGFGLIFSRYVKNMMDQIDTNVEVLNTLIQDGIFNYLINCK